MSETISSLQLLMRITPLSGDNLYHLTNAITLKTNKKLKNMQESQLDEKINSNTDHWHPRIVVK